jgi:hypothetical protein
LFLFEQLFLSEHFALFVCRQFKLKDGRSSSAATNAATTSSSEQPTAAAATVGQPGKSTTGIGSDRTGTSCPWSKWKHGPQNSTNETSRILGTERQGFNFGQ